MSQLDYMYARNDSMQRGRFRNRPLTEEDIQHRAAQRARVLEHEAQTQKLYPDNPELVEQEMRRYISAMAATDGLRYSNLSSSAAARLRMSADPFAGVERNPLRALTDNPIGRSSRNFEARDQQRGYEQGVTPDRTTGAEREARYGDDTVFGEAARAAQTRAAAAQAAGGGTGGGAGGGFLDGLGGWVRDNPLPALGLAAAGGGILGPMVFGRGGGQSPVVVTTSNQPQGGQ